MKDKLKSIKYAVIAAGVITSAAFYVLGGEGPDPALSGSAAEGTEIVLLDEETAQSAGRGENGRTAAGGGSTGSAAETGQERSSLTDNGSIDSVNAAALEVTGLSETAKEEIDAIVRTAVREELVSITKEGYLEAALSQAAAAAEAEAAAHEGMVNLNTADKAELMTLPGIGEKKAEDIIAYRDAHGPFGAIEDIRKISGIKDAAFGKIRDKIYV